MAKASEPIAVLVVMSSFVGELDGSTVTFKAGELIEGDHPAIRKWPAAFGPVRFPYPVDRTDRIERATAGPGEKRGA
jgi:hypothetical protein